MTYDIPRTREALETLLAARNGTKGYARSVAAIKGLLAAMRTPPPNPDNRAEASP